MLHTLLFNNINVNFLIIWDFTTIVCYNQSDEELSLFQHFSSLNNLFQNVIFESLLIDYILAAYTTEVLLYILYK